MWINPEGEYIVVDYKVTAKDQEVSLDADWQIGYKRQMQIYQWLFRKNGFKVSKTGYFVYCNGNTDKDAFDGKLKLDIKIIPYEGDTSWVEPTILDAIKYLKSDKPPNPDPDCDFCRYRKATREALSKFEKIIEKETKRKMNQSINFAITLKTIIA